MSRATAKTIMRLLWIMLAGALGAAARYGLTIGIANWMGKSGRMFPLGTLVINVLGTLLLSVLVTLVLHHAVDVEWRFILGTGFLGAFTTFSTFAVESEELMARADWKLAALSIGGNLLGGLIAVFAGRMLALRMLNVPPI